MEKHETVSNEIMTITSQTILGKVLKRYPELIDNLVAVGFAQLKNPAARKIVANVITINQAASFQGMNPNELLGIIKDVLKDTVIVKTDDENPEAQEVSLRPGSEGDLSFLGIVPCPIRNVIVEKFDSFAQAYNSQAAKKLSWDVAGEGTAGKDVLITMMGIANTRKYEKLPDIFTAVGRDIFIHNFYGGKIYRNNVWQKIGTHPNANPDFGVLEDERGILRLQFCVHFILSCQVKKMGAIEPPRSWMDLVDPKYEGFIYLPSLNLPIIPELLGALYYFYGEENFKKFAANCKNDLHPAGISPRRQKNEIPGIFILPEQFAKLSVNSGASVVYPAEGSVAIPAYIVAKNPLSEEGNKILEFLSGTDYLDIFVKNASLHPNHKAYEMDSKLKPLITRPWSDILENNPQAYTIRLIQMIKDRRNK